MFRDILNGLFSPYSLLEERCLAAITAFLILATVAFLGVLAFNFVDSVGITPTKTTITTIEVKQVVPTHTTFMLAGKIIVPQYHPESYRIHLKIDGKEISSAVEKKFFDDISVGDRIEVDYGFGRLSNSYQLTRIRLVRR